MLAWTKQKTMQRAMRKALEWPQGHATSMTHQTNISQSDVDNVTHEIENLFQSAYKNTFGTYTTKESKEKSLTNRGLTQNVDRPEICIIK